VAGPTLSAAAASPLPPIEARVATEADLDPIAETMALALHESPVWTWAFPDPEARVRAQRGIWRYCFAAALEYGWAWQVEDCAAAALWIPPGKPEMPPEAAARFDPFLDELLGEDSPRIRDMFARFAAAHPVQRGPHYYLNLLATHPDHAGRGLGRALLADNLARIDAEGADAFLETTTPARNVPLYERFGFVLEGRFPISDGGLEVAQMWRAAR
jgi:GNAT superfamily N-acetyltransferase